MNKRLKKCAGLGLLMLVSGTSTLLFICLSPFLAIHTLVTGKDDLYEALNNQIQDFYYIIGKNIKR